MKAAAPILLLATTGCTLMHQAPPRRQEFMDEAQESRPVGPGPVRMDIPFESCARWQPEYGGQFNPFSDYPAAITVADLSILYGVPFLTTLFTNPSKLFDFSKPRPPHWGKCDHDELDRILRDRGLKDR